MRTKVPVSCRTVFALILLFVSLTSCVIPARDVYETSVIRVDEKDVKTRLPWLVDGKTTKEEVIRHENFWDVNPRILSQGKILVYCINWDEQKAQYVGSTKCFHQLVLVFDEKGILKRFSILMMNYG